MAYGDPIDPPGHAMTPLQVIRSMRWVGDLDAREIVEAIRVAADADLEARWPELSADEIADMRRLCRTMTKSRLRTWGRKGDLQPTWLEVRALATGLHSILK